MEPFCTGPVIMIVHDMNTILMITACCITVEGNGVKKEKLSYKGRKAPIPIIIISKSGYVKYAEP